MRFSTLLTHHVAIQINKHGFTRCDIVHTLKAQRIERYGLRRQHPFVAFWRCIFTEHQRTNAEWVTEGQQAITRNHHHHSISTTYTLMHTAHGCKDSVLI